MSTGIVKLIAREALSYLRYYMLVPVILLWSFMIAMVGAGMLFVFVRDVTWIKSLVEFGKHFFPIPDSFSLDIKDAWILGFYAKVSLIIYLVASIVGKITKRKLEISLKNKTKVLILIPLLCYSFILVVFRLFLNAPIQWMVICAVFGIITIGAGLLYMAVEAFIKFTNWVFDQADNQPSGGL